MHVNQSETRLPIQQEQEERQLQLATYEADLARNNELRREREAQERNSTLPPVVLSEFYKYQPIPDDPEGPYTTRLLELEAGGGHDPLRGRLQVLRVGLGPKYRALSYVWGPPRPTDKIDLDGKQLDITPSLASALRQFRSPTTPLLIWIDQICINQKDTVERSAQVRLMHDIFRQADEVLVWLGPDANKDASRAFRLAKSLRAILDDELLSSICKKAGTDFNWIHDRYWKSLRHLCKQSWFRRAWIPQEIGTDAPATIHWGTESMDWAALCASMQKLEHCWDLKKKYGINPYPVTALFRRFVQQDGSPSERARGNFVFQLCLSARNCATDPRDYVYSQLGHYSAILAPGVRIINPDYDNSVHDIYHEVAIRVLQHIPGLMTLNAVLHDGELKSAASSPAPIPSWVPRWDARGPYSVIGYPGRFSASGDRGHELTFRSKFQCLVVKGARIDTIMRTSPKFQIASPNTFLKGQICEAWDLCPRQARKAKPEWFNNNSTWDPNLATWNLGAFLDTLAPKAAISELAALTPSFESGLRALENIFPAQRKEFQAAITVPFSDGKPKPAVWTQVAEDHAIGRKFAVTKTGFIMMAPPSVAKGDLLCVLFGGETPYILRESKPKRYQFVGEAYAHGLMDGEAMTMLESELLSEEAFEVW